MRGFTQAEGSVARSDSESLLDIARRHPASQCHLLIQKQGFGEAFADKFDELVVASGAPVHQVPLPPLPEVMWPQLVGIDLDQGVGSALSSLAIEAASSDLSLKALRSGKPHRVCAWLFADVTSPAIVAGIRRNAIQPHPGRKGRHWLRFYDPLVMDVFWPILTDSQRGALLKGIQAWVFFGRSGSLKQLSADQLSDSIPPQALSGAQWEKLKHVGTVNQAWLRCAGEGLPIETSTVVATLDLMVNAQRYTVGGKADAELFAYHLMRYGSRFQQAPGISRILESTSQDDGYAFLTQSLSDDDWQSISNFCDRLHERLGASGDPVHG